MSCQPPIIAPARVTAAQPRGRGSPRSSTRPGRRPGHRPAPASAGRTRPRPRWPPVGLAQRQVGERRAAGATPAAPRSCWSSRGDACACSSEAQASVVNERERPAGVGRVPELDAVTTVAIAASSARRRRSPTGCSRRSSGRRCPAGREPRLPAQPVHRVQPVGPLVAHRLEHAARAAGTRQLDTTTWKPRSASSRAATAVGTAPPVRGATSTVGASPAAGRSGRCSTARRRGPGPKSRGTTTGG